MTEQELELRRLLIYVLKCMILSQKMDEIIAWCQKNNVAIWTYKQP